MRRSGFTFVEILIGIIILVIGLVPLMLAYSMATKETRVSISQIQAINHAANLLEALRAFGAQDFKNLTYFPAAMEQRKGGDNVWVPLSGDETMLTATAAAAGTPVPAMAGTNPGEGDDRGSGEKNFTTFKTTFMSGTAPVVAKLEERFKRSFQLLRKGGYVTVVVRVAWEEEDLAASTKPQVRVIELRTVVADPYLATSNLNSGATGNTTQTDTPAAPTTTGGGNTPSRPLPPAPRLGVTPPR